MATLARHSGVVQDQAGNIIPNAKIEVRRETPGAPLAALKEDRDGLVGLSNPFDAEADGSFAFHVIGGAYKVRAYVGASGAPTFEYIERFVANGTAAEHDAEDFVAAGTVRERLTADRTYHVAPSGSGGSDSNDGLTALAPFLTIQKAVDVAATVDLAGYKITIQLADGTYTAGVVLKNVGGFAAPGDLVIKGNTTTPANVIVSPTSADAFLADSIASVWDVTDLKIQTTTSGNGLFARYGAKIRYGNLNFGTCASSHIQAFGPGSVITCLSNYAITGGAQIHFQSYYGAQIVAAGRTITITGTLTISIFADMRVLGSAQLFSMTFAGTYTVTGSRYRSQENAVCFVNGAGATYFPGNSSGTTATGGLYT
ncbi:MAG: hypothetical protein AB7F72_01700 [Afipia sp.]